MVYNRRATRRITAALLAVLMLISAWILPAFAEGDAADTVTETTQEGTEDTREAADGAEGVPPSEVAGGPSDFMNPDEQDNGDPDEAEPDKEGAADDGLGEPGSAGGSAQDAGESDPVDTDSAATPTSLGFSGIMPMSATVNDTEVTVDLSNPGDLQSEIATVLNPPSLTEASITKLIVTGPMNSVDMGYIASNMSSLKEMDLSGATYSGGMPASQFQNNSTLEKVALPSGMDSIGDSAFNFCSSLTDIVLPASLTSIGDQAFFACNSLLGIDLSVCVNLSSIGDQAFDNCMGMTSINLSGLSSLSTIGKKAFANCMDLTSVDLSDSTSLSIISESMFEGCVVMISVNLPASITSIEKNAFYGCQDLTGIDLSGTALLDIGVSAFEDCGALASVSVPASLTNIGEAAFKNSGLASLDLSVCTGLTIIELQAFENCSNLTSVNFPSSLASIQQKAFGNSGITGVDLSNCSGLTDLGQEAFYDCVSLVSVDLSGTALTSFGPMTFYRCNNMTNISLPDSMTTLGNDVFDQCTSLQSIVMPAGLTTIGSNTFSGCTGLLEIDLSKCVNLTSLESLVFNGCTNLATVRLPNTSTIIPAASNSFANCVNTEVIVPIGLLSFYQSDSDWAAAVSAGQITLSGGYTITIIQATGGTVDVSTQISLPGETITLDVTEDSSSTALTGWTTTPSSLNITGSGGSYSFTMPTQNVTITPKFGTVAPTTYTVTYHPNGGTGAAPTESNKAAGATFAAAANSFVAPTGHYFKEWNTQANGSGTSYPAGATVTMPRGALDLYAIWDTIPLTTYTITFDPNGGSVSPKTMQTGPDGTLAYLPTPTRSGSYTFEGWYTAASGGTGITVLHVFTADATIYAQWKYTGENSTSEPAGTTSSSRSRSETKSVPVQKIRIPDSAFIWDWDRTLTIEYDNITPLGLMSVAWDNRLITSYSAYAGSVIIRFDRDFIVSQVGGEHTIRVEFLNHYGETTVSTGGYIDPVDADPQNPSTGGDNLNPRTGDFSNPWRWMMALIPAAAIMTGAASLLIMRRRSRKI